MLNMSGRSATTVDGKNMRKTWEWMIIDSLIIGAIGFFAALPEGMPTQATFYIALKAFGLAFVIQLAIERGIKRE